MLSAQSGAPVDEARLKIGTTASQPGRRSALLPLLPCVEIGRYEVLYPLATGGMASVHVARLLGIGGFERLVALKIVHPHLAQEEEFVHMFLDEARLAASIHHPNVGEVIEVGEEEGLFYMVSELVMGHDLRGLVRRMNGTGERLSADLVAHIAGEVARGLHAAHEVLGSDGESLNLVHRDVTPRNILVSYDGAVKLIDFGVALARGRHTQSTVSTIKGQAGFVSPEAIRGEPVDRRSDVFSLGVVLYWLLTRTYPFVGRGEVDWIQRVLSGRFHLPRSVDHGIPPELEKVVLRAMAHRPEDRYQSAAQMADDLDAFIGARQCRDLGKRLAQIVRERFADELVEHEDHLRVARGLGPSTKPPERQVSRQRVMQTPLGIEFMDVGPDGRRRVRWNGLLGMAAGLGATILLALAVLPMPPSQPPSAAVAPPLQGIRVRVLGVPMGAELYLDGRRVQSGELLLAADGAYHKLELRLAGRSLIRELLATTDTVIDFNGVL